ncbi:MAG: BTAD domain-containing putative transcriptional regulator, partial [Gemmatimonadota bacterium]
LASPRPGTWHRRDTLLAVFWPELDTGRARAALRSALYSLRQHLGDGVLSTRGDDEVSLDPGHFVTDAALLEAAVSAGDYAAALERYGGELLPGLFVPEAEGFEKWQDGERGRLKGLARQAAVALTQEREQAGDGPGAATAAARAVTLDPDDEAALRRWMGLLEQTGDRVHALAAYERFRTRLTAEFGAEPSPETVSLARAIRARRGPEEQPLPPVGGGLAGSLSPAPIMAEAGASAPAAQPTDPPLRGRMARAFPQLLLAGGLGLLVVVGVSISRRHEQKPSPAPPAKSIIVLPMENATGDSRLAYIATGLANDVARRLRNFGGLLEVRSAARADWPEAATTDFTLLGREFGSEIAARSRLTRADDSLTVTVELVDLKTGHVREAGRQRFTATGLEDAASRVAALVAGAVFRAPIPNMTRATAAPVDPESYRLTLQGWHALMSDGKMEAAAKYFRQATDRDPTNARAWSGLSSYLTIGAVWGDHMPTQEEYVRAEAASNRALALDSLQGTAWANLGMLRALTQRRLGVGESLIQRGIHAEPGNPELYAILSALYRQAWLWDKSLDAIRIARQMDPLTPSYAGREGDVAMCANRPEEALRVYRAEIGLDSADIDNWQGAAWALARLGRFDDALALLRQSPEKLGPAVARSLATARGAEGYWQVRELGAKQLVAAALRGENTDAASPLWMGLDYLAAGEVDRGLTTLEQEQRKGNWNLIRLPCKIEVERWRELPRYQALLARTAAAFRLR